MVAASHQGENLYRLQLDARVLSIFRFEGPSREPGLVATGLAAIAGAALESRSSSGMAADCGPESPALLFGP